MFYYKISSFLFTNKNEVNISCWIEYIKYKNKISSNTVPKPFYKLPTMISMIIYISTV